MAQVTIRQVEEEWVATAKAKAAERGVSMNTVLREAIASGLGIASSGLPPRKGNLDRFAGDSPDEFGEEWEKAMEVFNEVDPEIWK